MCAQVGGLGEDMKVHKSQLERDQEAAQAAHAARKKAGVNPLTPFPHKVLPSDHVAFSHLRGPHTTDEQMCIASMYVEWQVVVSVSSDGACNDALQCQF